MEIVRKSNPIYTIPEGLIVLISGVPGVGKTTISYELLKKFSEFRIIEETDIIREVLRGYNEFLRIKFGDQIGFLLNKVLISDHTKLLTFDEAKLQCEYMKKSIEKIICRQQRKKIASIINGVHIIPEVLDGLMGNNNIVYINLYVTDEHEIYERIFCRDSTSYMLNYIPFIFQTNKDLYLSTEKLSLKSNHIFNIDVTGTEIASTIDKIIYCINECINICKKG